MTITIDDMQNYLPYYLTKEQKAVTADALSKFPHNTDYYWSGDKHCVYQGDGWTGLHILNFDSGDKMPISGMIISNTCDISPENHRDLPLSVTFVPIIPLAAVEEMLKQSGAKKESIRGKLEAIRKQTVTTFFYLPTCDGVLKEEHVAWFDDMHSMPTEAFYSKKNKERERLFSLNQMGFYLFLMKISIHFCRMHEEVVRLPPISAEPA